MRHNVGPESLPPADSSIIVVGHDESEHADRALAEAFALAEALGAKLRVVRTFTITTVHSPVMPDFGYVASVEELRDEVQKSLDSDIADVVTAHPDVTVETYGVLGGPSSCLLAASEGARMLVVGSRGRGGLKGMLLGSVSSQAVQHASCPVLVTR